MLTQKIFHVKMSAQETKERLSDLSFYQRRLSGVVRAVSIADGVGEVEVEMGSGFRAGADIGVVSGEQPNEILFHSLKGNIDLAGMIELSEIKPELTEVVLTLDYSVKAPFYRLMDLMTDSVDRFLNSSLAELEHALNGTSPMPAEYAEHTPFGQPSYYLSH